MDHPPAQRSRPSGADGDVRARVRTDDEDAFLRLVQRWSPAVRRVARLLVPSSSPDPDTVAGTLETGAWRRAIPRLDHDRGQDAPPSAVLRALLDEARAAGLLTAGSAAYRRPPTARTTDPRWFRPADDPQWPGHWASPPRPWPGTQGSHRPGPLPDGLADAAARLPEPQRVVVALRDAGGCGTELVSRLLEVDPGQVRRLLNAGRATLRLALDAERRAAVAVAGPR